VRVVVDTGVLLQVVTGAGPGASPIYRAWRTRRFALLTSETQLEELAEVMERPGVRRRMRFARGLPANGDHSGRWLLDLLRQTAILVTPIERVALCRDEDDDYLLAMAASGQASHLVTVDKDLYDDPILVSTMWERYRVRVVTAADFVVELAGGDVEAEWDDDEQGS
jgi:putative PIN family toxin of toxin-antitoxin system